MKKATRVSGQLSFDLSYTLGGPDTTFAVRIDDLAPDASSATPVTMTTLDGPVEKRLHDLLCLGPVVVPRHAEAAGHLDADRWLAGGAGRGHPDHVRLAAARLHARAGAPAAADLLAERGRHAGAPTGGTVTLLRRASTVRMPIARLVSAG